MEGIHLGSVSRLRPNENESRSSGQIAEFDDEWDYQGWSTIRSWYWGVPLGFYAAHSRPHARWVETVRLVETNEEYANARALLVKDIEYYENEIAEADDDEEVEYVPYGLRQLERARTFGAIIQLGQAVEGLMGAGRGGGRSARAYGRTKKGTGGGGGGRASRPNARIVTPPAGAQPFTRVVVAGRHHFIPRGLGSLLPYGHKSLPYLSSPTHTRLQNALDAFLRGRTKTLPNGRTVDMMPRKGNPGSQVRQFFTPQERLNAVDEFYRTFEGGRYYPAYRMEFNATVNTGKFR